MYPTISIKKVLPFVAVVFLLTAISSCGEEVAAPPGITYISPSTKIEHPVNTPLTLKANLRDNSGLGKVKVYIYSAWKKNKVFVDMEETLNGAESVEYTNTFVIDELINYPKATYVIELTVTDTDGNVRHFEELISLKP